MQTAKDAYRILIAEPVAFRGSGKRCSQGGIGQAMHGHRRRAWRPDRIIKRASPAFQTLFPFRSCPVSQDVNVIPEPCAELPLQGRPACE